MSSIIDALKRAEAERLSLSGYELLNFHINLLPRTAGRKLKFLLGIGLMASFLFASWVLIYSIFAGNAPDHTPAQSAPAAGSGVRAPVKARSPAPTARAAQREAERQASLRKGESLKVLRESPAAKSLRDSFQRPAAPEGKGEKTLEARGPAAPRRQTPSRLSPGIQARATKPSRLSSPAPRTGAEARRRAESLFRRARAHEAGGDLRAAVKAYAAAIALSPGLLEARLNLGNIYFEQGDYQKAIAQYLAALREDPTYAKAHTNLGVAYAEAGSLHLAMNEYKLSIRYEPDNFIPYFNLGGLYARLGRHEMALGYLKRALELSEEAKTLALTDPDYMSLKKTTAFKKLLKGS